MDKAIPTFGNPAPSSVLTYDRDPINVKMHTLFEMDGKNLPYRIVGQKKSIIEKQNLSLWK